MRTYNTVKSSASSGACIRTAKGLANASMTTARIKDSTTNRQIAPPTTRPAFSGFFSPIYWPMTTVTPIVSPVIVKVTRFTILLPVDTPEMPAVVPNRPTTRISTAPYIACRTSAPKIGIINLSSLETMLPCVKSFLFSAIFYYPHTNVRFLTTCLSIFSF